MIQQSHFWIYNQRNGKQGLVELFAYHIHSSILHNSQEVETTSNSISGGMDKQMWSIHTMEYYPALIWKETLPHATTWMKLEDIMLSEIRQSQKDKYYVKTSVCQGEKSSGDGRW